uniref:Uncharacterized protein n=1 Tax=Arundo donax TaxID=35708 RepID=A0A0A8ZAN5_ARUDO
MQRFWRWLICRQYNTPSSATSVVDWTRCVSASINTSSYQKSAPQYRHV